MKFESTGWDRVDISPASLDAVETEIGNLGVDPVPFDLVTHVAPFAEYVEAPEYAGAYRTYGGEERHCFLEKALEHYVAFHFIQPKAGFVGIDIGSCMSVAPAIARRVFGATVYEQDLVYPTGVHEHRIGSSADAIPLADGTVDFMMLHCTFEHFEGRADTGFVRECARLLKPGGKVVILPLYLNLNYCNVTGETDATVREGIGFDQEAGFHCIIPEWRNRFGRHYSPEALCCRVLVPAKEAGLISRLIRCRNWEVVDPRIWLRWILVLEKTEESRAAP